MGGDEVVDKTMDEDMILYEFKFGGIYPIEYYGEDEVRFGLKFMDSRFFIYRRREKGSIREFKHCPIEYGLKLIDEDLGIDKDEWKGKLNVGVVKLTNDDLHINEFEGWKGIWIIDLVKTAGLCGNITEARKSIHNGEIKIAGEVEDRIDIDIAVYDGMTVEREGYKSIEIRVVDEKY